MFFSRQVQESIPVRRVCFPLFFFVLWSTHIVFTGDSALKPLWLWYVHISYSVTFSRSRFDDGRNVSSIPRNKKKVFMFLTCVRKDLVHFVQVVLLISPLFVVTWDGLGTYASVGYSLCGRWFLGDV